MSIFRFTLAYARADLVLFPLLVASASRAERPALKTRVTAQGLNTPRAILVGTCEGLDFTEAPTP